MSDWRISKAGTPASDDMGKRIEEAKRKIDLSREEKNSLADECKVDVTVMWWLLVRKIGTH